MLSRKIPANSGQYVRCCHTRSKLPDPIVAGTQAVEVRPWICELVHPVDRGRRRILPFAAGGVKQVNIPGDPALPAEAVSNCLAG